MLEFNNEVYKELVQDLINDAFYLDARSRRGTISTIRQYAEVIIRKILDLAHETQVTVGNRNIISQLEVKSGNNPILMNSLKIIKDNGNNCTHTQKIASISEEDVNRCIESLFNLYAYLFIAYFRKFKFGTNNRVMESFSILPPIN